MICTHHQGPDYRLCDECSDAYIRELEAKLQAESNQRAELLIAANATIENKDKALMKLEAELEAARKACRIALRRIEYLNAGTEELGEDPAEEALKAVLAKEPR